MTTPIQTISIIVSNQIEGSKSVSKSIIWYLVISARYYSLIFDREHTPRGNMQKRCKELICNSTWKNSSKPQLILAHILKSPTLIFYQKGICRITQNSETADSYRAHLKSIRFNFTEQNPIRLNPILSVSTRVKTI